MSKNFFNMFDGNGVIRFLEPVPSYEEMSRRIMCTIRLEDVDGEMLYILDGSIFKYAEWFEDYNAPVYITAFDKIILIGPNGANIIPPDGRLQSLLFRTVTEQRNAYDQIMESRARDELSAIFLGIK